MTSAAVRSEFSIMNIVCPVAVATTAVDSLDVVERLAVTRFAGNVNMRALEREIGLRIVIEQPDLPVDGVVTCIASRMEVAVVRIIFEVTRIAVTLCIRERLGFVAILAFHVIVLAK